MSLSARRPGDHRCGVARQGGDGGKKPYLSQAHIPISPDQGQYMYQTARLIGAKTLPLGHGLEYSVYLG